MRATALSLLPQVARSPQALLHTLSGCAPGVMGMDAAEGCAASCIHCSGGHAGERYSGATQVNAVVAVAQRLEAELEALAGMGQRPSRLRLGLVSDPLLPGPTVVAAHACLKVAVKMGVAVEIHTRQVLEADTVELLKAHRHMVHVVLGVMSVSDAAARVYEANLPPPAGRLRALRPLLAAAVPVTVRVEPLIPLVNDTEADLEALFELVVKNGARRVEMAYLALTPETAKSLSRGLPRMHRDMLKGLFAQEPWVDGPDGQRKLLPRVLRESGYERAMTAARRVGLLPTVCAAAEPELRLARHCVRPLGDNASTKPVSTKPVSTLPTSVSQPPTASQLGLFGDVGALPPLPLLKHG